MRDILQNLNQWQKQGKQVVLATVIQTWGSSPRGVGSRMAFTTDGDIAGSVSGGCVENAVIEAGLKILRTGKPAILKYGVADETAWEVGLACGGKIEVFVKPFNQDSLAEFQIALDNEQDALAVMVVDGPEHLTGRELLVHGDGRVIGTLGNELDALVLKKAQETFSRRQSNLIQLTDETWIFQEILHAPQTLVLVGGVHISMALVSLAGTLGYRTIVIDPRKAWNNSKRFPHADRLIQDWPMEAFGKIQITGSTAIVMLTHDPKLDDPALKIALASPAFYVGALGSRVTQAKRRARLLESGLNEFQLSRLHAPIGLDIGARSPEEIALSIMAEIVEAHQKREPAQDQRDA